MYKNRIKCRYIKMSHLEVEVHHEFILQLTTMYFLKLNTGICRKLLVNQAGKLYL